MEENEGYFDDFGNKMDPNLVPKPGLCLTCIYDDEPVEEELCILTRMDQMDKDEFRCEEYKSKYGSWGL